MTFSIAAVIRREEDLSSTLIRLFDLLLPHLLQLLIRMLILFALSTCSSQFL